MPGDRKRSPPPHSLSKHHHPAVHLASPTPSAIASPRSRSAPSPLPRSANRRFASLHRSAKTPTPASTHLPPRLRSTSPPPPPSPIAIVTIAVAALPHRTELARIGFLSAVPPNPRRSPRRIASAVADRPTMHRTPSPPLASSSPARRPAPYLPAGRGVSLAAADPPSHDSPVGGPRSATEADPCSSSRNSTPSPSLLRRRRLTPSSVSSMPHALPRAMGDGKPAAFLASARLRRCSGGEAGSRKEAAADRRRVLGERQGPKAPNFPTMVRYPRA